MSSRLNSDEDLLAQLIRDAGDPSVEAEPGFADRLRAMVLDRVGAEHSTATSTEAGGEAGRPSALNVERALTMRRLARLAVAATVLVALGSLALWGSGGGSVNMAFADVVKALDDLKTATYDFTSEIKSPVDGKATTVKSKGYFMVPSLERLESTTSFGSDQNATHSVMILDCLALKAITLLPAQKKALVINIEATETSTGGTANMFDLVRHLIDQEKNDSQENVESLGEQEIDGRTALGFKIRKNMADMTLWADPQTAQLVRVDYDLPSGDGRMVMSNIRYDVELDRSLFSLEPPDGYAVETQTVTPPTEEDLVNVLRFVAEYNNGTFPDSLSTNEKTFMLALQADAQAESFKLLATPEVQKRIAEVMAEYADDKDEGMKAWMKEWMEMAGPITQEHTRQYTLGVMFYASLGPKNDSYYAGQGVNLNTTDRPIFWYRPTGAENYRVVYADLSVKDMTAEEVEELSEADGANAEQ